MAHTANLFAPQQWPLLLQQVLLKLPAAWQLLALSEHPTLRRRAVVVVASAVVVMEPRWDDLNLGAAAAFRPLGAPD